MKVVKQTLSPQMQYAYDEAKKFVLDKIDSYNVLSGFEFGKIEEALSNIYFDPSNKANHAQFVKSSNPNKYAYTIKLSQDFNQEMLNHEMMHAASAILTREISFVKKFEEQKFKYKGIVESFNNHFAGQNEGDNAYVFPEVFAKLICKKIGEEHAFKFFIKGDLNGLAEKIKDAFKLKDTKLVYELFENLDLFVDQKEVNNKTTLLNRTQCVIGAVCNCASIYSKMLANKDYLEGERNPKEIYWQTINDLSLDYSITEYYRSAKDENGNQIKIEGDNLIKFEFLKEDLKEYFLMKDIEKTMASLAEATILSGDSATPVAYYGLKK